MAGAPALGARPVAVGAGLFVAVALVRVAVPGVGVVHVGAGGEHAALAAQEHHLDVVVVGQLVQEDPQLLAHGRVVGVAPLRVVQREARDAGVVVALHPHSAVAHSERASQGSVGVPAGSILS